MFTVRWELHVNNIVNGLGRHGSRLPQRRPGFEIWPVHVTFVVLIVAVGRFAYSTRSTVSGHAVGA